MTLCQPVLTRLRGLATLTAECACGTAATTTTTAAGRTIARRAALEVATALTGTEAATSTTAALAGTVMAPLAGTGNTLTGTTAEATALSRTLTGTPRTTGTTTFDIRPCHGMRTRNVTRSGGVHALLARERIVARTGARNVRTRNGVIATVARGSGTRRIAAVARGRTLTILRRTLLTIRAGTAVMMPAGLSLSMTGRSGSETTMRGSGRS